MDLEKWKVIQTILATGSLTKAGEQIGFSQSGISHLIKSVEKDLGFSIMTRNKYGVKLTSEGSQLHPLVQEMIKLDEKFNQIVSSIHGVATGTIRIGTFHSISTQWLPKIIYKFRTDYPNIKIQLMEGGMDQLEMWLKDNYIDLAFLSYKDHRQSKWIPLKEDHLVAVLPPNHPLATKDYITPTDFMQNDFILSSPGFDYDVNSYFQKNNILPNVNISSMDDFSVISMVSKNLGISILPALLLQTPDSTIVTKPLNPCAKRVLGIAVKSYSNASIATEKLIEYSQAILK
ncbi:LysR family transcriptional regulator [Pelosinus propionicus]|uniref:DNA-binding transcriptional regulator, LysR family n=1 Tax=Pelosinus propionicus DSM 13327 TaxID=1123291 RepID=A0A1I4LQ97_9FIRM|nr:LysR family transcriptional regulator [Pelosinus propionicus]SFL93150.1 DNA-binding transcriptional regulator, LysR family [Pelosinus propionicus DSM 13327]